jgi:hypothetical protein
MARADQIGSGAEWGMLALGEQSEDKESINVYAVKW